MNLDSQLADDKNENIAAYVFEDLNTETSKFVQGLI